MHTVQLVLIYRSKRNDAHEALIKTIGAQQLELERGLRDQRDTMKSIRFNTGRIRDNQAFLVESMSTRHTEVRDHLRSQARDLESAFASQRSTTVQIGVDVQNTNSQLQALLALQHSFIGFVFSRYLIRETRSYVADILQRCNVFPRATTSYHASESFPER